MLLHDEDSAEVQPQHMRGRLIPLEQTETRQTATKGFSLKVFLRHQYRCETETNGYCWSSGCVLYILWRCMEMKAGNLQA